MIYNLLKRIQNLLASKPSGTKEEQEILSLGSQALPAMLNGREKPSPIGGKRENLLKI